MYRYICIIPCVFVFMAGVVQAQPDVIVGSLPGTNAYGSNTVAGEAIYAYSVATTSCNIGDENLDWIANTSAASEDPGPCHSTSAAAMPT